MRAGQKKAFSKCRWRRDDCERSADWAKPDTVNHNDLAAKAAPAEHSFTHHYYYYTTRRDSDTTTPQQRSIGDRAPFKSLIYIRRRCFVITSVNARERAGNSPRDIPRGDGGGAAWFLTFSRSRMRARCRGNLFFPFDSLSFCSRFSASRWRRQRSSINKTRHYEGRRVIHSMWMNLNERTERRAARERGLRSVRSVFSPHSRMDG